MNTHEDHLRYSKFKNDLEKSAIENKITLEEMNGLHIIGYVTTSYMLGKSYSDALSIIKEFLEKNREKYEFRKVKK